VSLFRYRISVSDNRAVQADAKDHEATPKARHPSKKRLPTLIAWIACIRAKYCSQSKR
jgi:hypothetical protein